MPLLELRKNNFDYNKEVIPFITNGIIIDTCVIETLIEGFIHTRISGKSASLMQDFTMIIGFLDIIKIPNSWDRFLITPHIITETFHRFREKEHYKGGKYKKVLEEIMPLIISMKEVPACKEEVLKHITYTDTRIEIGDFSIYVVANDFLKQDKKIAVLSADDGVTSKYMDDPNVLGMNYKYIMLNYN